jgi:hypothetical protein
VPAHGDPAHIRHPVSGISLIDSSGARALEGPVDFANTQVSGAGIVPTRRTGGLAEAPC